MSEQAERSPNWNASTKLVVGLTLVAILAALLIRFNSLIGPLILAFTLSYVLHPVARRLSKTLDVSWRMAVNLLFLLVIILLISLFTILGVAILEQLGNLIVVVQNFVANLPELANDLSTQVYQVGPFRFDFSELESRFLGQIGLDFSTLGEQALSAIQPVLGGAGTLIGTLATSALGTLGWGAFVLVISYFILGDAGQVPNFLRNVELPGHDEDLRRFGRELGRIWNAFMRGQLLLFILIIISTFLLFSFLGVRNALGLAFLAGLAKFVPYIGPLIASITTALVAFFQQGNYLGIESPWTYALIVVISALVLDQIYDNLITPRIYGQTLGVHPAAVLVAALIAANLLGIIGLLLAAPVLASLQLALQYALRKMLDLDPWPKPEPEPESTRNPLARALQWLKQTFERLQEWIKRRTK